MACCHMDFMNVLFGIFTIHDMSKVLRLHQGFDILDFADFGLFYIADVRLGTK